MKVNIGNIFKPLIGIVLLVIFLPVLNAQVSREDTLMFGAEIFIEPEQSDENVES